MIRAPRPRWSILFATLITALLAFPAGIVLAAHQFNDVPNSNAFHADIDALVDAGVTAGCGNNNYCPKANVTREQMAAFMNRLGALAPGKTPVVNADRVDGYQANGLTRVAGASGPAGLVAITANFPTYQTATQIVINAPSAGFVLVNASVAAQTSATSCTGTQCNVFARLRHANNGTLAPYQVIGVHGTTAPNNSVSLSYVFPVAAGNNTFQLQIARATNTQSPSYFSPQITGLFTPFGSTGGATLGNLDAPAVDGPQGGVSE